MEPSHHLTRRERLIRLAGGLGLVVAGCVAYGVSQAHDPKNRAALIGIFAVLVGLSWIGQGLRGRREGVIVHQEEPRREIAHISAEKTVAGILLAWILPGAGHLLIGRRGKALLFFATITVTFLIGVALAEGRNLNYERDKVYFLAYMFNAGETALGWLLTHDLELVRPIPYLQLGFLYTAVACLLNVVAMMDFVATCGLASDTDADVEDEIRELGL